MLIYTGVAGKNGVEKEIEVTDIIELKETGYLEKASLGYFDQKLSHIYKNAQRNLVLGGERKRRGGVRKKNSSVPRIILQQLPSKDTVSF